jgi:hypothetical protein
MGRVMSIQSDLLNEVAEVISGARNRNYGPPRVNLDERTASLWNTYIGLLGNEEDWTFSLLDGVDVCNMMILVKMARIIEDRHHKDNYADMAGYAAAAWEIANG